MGNCNQTRDGNNVILLCSETGGTGEKIKGKFSFLKLRTKIDGKRGSTDPRSVIELMVEVWNEFSMKITELDSTMQQDIKDHFNGIIEDEDDLGDILFGPVD